MQGAAVNDGGAGEYSSRSRVSVPVPDFHQQEPPVPLDKAAVILGSIPVNDEC